MTRPCSSARPGTRPTKSMTMTTTRTMTSSATEVGGEESGRTGARPSSGSKSNIRPPLPFKPSDLDSFKKNPDEPEPGRHPDQSPISAHRYRSSRQTWTHSRRIRTNRSPAVIRIKVQYPPTVTVQAVRPGLIQEGSKASYRCIAEANPAPSGDSYTWYIDNDRVPNQFQSYFEIYNVSRVHHDKQVRCSVRNQLGKAEGLKSIQVKWFVLKSISDGPTIVQQPRTTAG